MKKKNSYKKTDLRSMKQKSLFVQAQDREKSVEGSLVTKESKTALSSEEEALLWGGNERYTSSKRHEKHERKI